MRIASFIERRTLNFDSVYVPAAVEGILYNIMSLDSGKGSGSYKYLVVL